MARWHFLVPALIVGSTALLLFCNWVPWPTGDGLPGAPNPQFDANAASYLSIFASQTESTSTILQTFAFGLCFLVGLFYKRDVFPKLSLGALDLAILSLFGVAIFLSLYFSYWLRISLISEFGLEGAGSDLLFIRAYLVEQAWAVLVSTLLCLVLVGMSAGRSAKRQGHSP